MCSIDNARARQRTTDDLSRSRISRRLVGRKWEASFSKASFSPRWRGFRTEVTGHACNAPPDQRTVHTGCANKHAPSRLDDERGKWERDRFELFLVFFFFFAVIFFLFDIRIRIVSWMRLYCARNLRRRR